MPHSFRVRKAIPDLETVHNILTEDRFINFRAGTESHWTLKYEIELFITHGMVDMVARAVMYSHGPDRIELARFKKTMLAMCRFRQHRIFENKTLNHKTGTGGIIDIVYFPYDDLRTLPSRGHVIGAEHVNGGSTSRGGVIHCFRKEESEKVLFHELIHSAGLDMDQLNGSLVAKHLHLDRSNAPLLLNETVTELLANLVIMKGRWSRFRIEFEFAVRQAAKLLVHNGFTDVYEFVKLKTTTVPALKERTNSVAYYFMRPVLYLNLAEFLECYTAWPQLDERLVRTMSATLNDRNYLDYFNSVMREVIEKKREKRLEQTMRMTSPR